MKGNPFWNQQIPTSILDKAGPDRQLLLARFVQAELWPRPQAAAGSLQGGRPWEGCRGCASRLHSVPLSHYD